MRIEPEPNSATAWPAGEGVLGVVGVAPWATLDFLRELYALVPAAKDWDYPRVLVDTNTKIPSRGRHLELGERDPSPFIQGTIAELARAGATVVVVVCNTAHILAERWAADAPVPVIDIVDATVEALDPGRSRAVAVLASNSLSRHDLYGSRLEASGFIPERPDSEHQALIAGLIESVKVHGSVPDGERSAVGRLVDWARARGVDTVLLGCTELSGLRQSFEAAGILAIDSNHALAAAALDAITPPAESPPGR